MSNTLVGVFCLPKRWNTKKYCSVLFTGLDLCYQRLTDAIVFNHSSYTHCGYVTTDNMFTLYTVRKCVTVKYWDTIITCPLKVFQLESDAKAWKLSVVRLILGERLISVIVHTLIWFWDIKVFFFRNSEKFWRFWKFQKIIEAWKVFNVLEGF